LSPSQATTSNKKAAEFRQPLANADFFNQPGTSSSKSEIRTSSLPVCQWIFIVVYDILERVFLTPINIERKIIK